jgi:hypothetical protein
MKRLLIAIWYVLNLRCADAERVACTCDRAALRRRERVGAFVHRCLCRSCRAAKRQIDVVDALLREQRERGGVSSESGPVLPADARARIRERLAASERN